MNRNLLRTTALVITVALLAGCATRGANYRPLVDMKDRSPAQFDTDLAQCQAYARERMDAASGAVVGAIAGALIGAILAPKQYRSNVANRGALLGAAGGAGEANDTQETITKRCLAGRGYNVLN